MKLVRAIPSSRVGCAGVQAEFASYKKVLITSQAHRQVLLKTVDSTSEQIELEYILEYRIPKVGK